MTKFGLIFVLFFTASFINAQKKSKERQVLEQKIQENIDAERRQQENQKRSRYIEDSTKKVKLANDNKIALARLEEYERREKLERKRDSLMDGIKRDEEHEKLQKKNSETVYINSMKSRSNFSFDSLALTTILNNRRDSLLSAGQTIKAGRLEKQIAEIERRLFSSGRIYSFQLIKRKDIIYYSYELESINIFSDFYSGRLIREGNAKHDHGPSIWETSDKIIEDYEDLKNEQVFILKIRLLPSTFSHINKGNKCGHDFSENRCKLLSIDPM